MANRHRYHTLKSGETLEQLARRHRYDDWTQIWKAPENRRLARVRGRPRNLQAGDRVYMPVTPEERRDVQGNIAALNARISIELARQTLIRQRIRRLKSTTRLLRAYAKKIDVICDQKIREIERARKGIKGVSTIVDVAATLSTLGVSLGSLARKAHKSTKLTGDALRKLNREVAKDVKKSIFKTGFDQGRRTLVAVKDTSAHALHIVNRSYDRMLSPSFWAMAAVQRFGEGKSWSAAATYDVDRDMDRRIAQIERDRRSYVRSIRKEIRRQRQHVAELRTLLGKSEQMIRMCAHHAERRAEMIE